jgi:hypothetical protein
MAAILFTNHSTYITPDGRHKLSGDCNKQQGRKEEFDEAKAD